MIYLTTVFITTKCKIGYDISWNAGYNKEGRSSSYHDSLLAENVIFSHIKSKLFILKLGLTINISSGIVYVYIFIISNNC
jgi:hypothetical protein